ncbi:MAG: ADP-glyceromanno-heptose 6-epimerase [Desulfobulbaceae bacterium]|nr:ADP-glyceromanno-heptose 6-epimerase [Desulfobulbaceae bacterium]
MDSSTRPKREQLLDKDDFLAQIRKGYFGSSKIKAIIHQGACSTTTEWNGKLVMDNNFTYPKELLHFAINNRIPFIYASSASVYGNGRVFIEKECYEQPLNIYAYSKVLFDRYVRQQQAKQNSQIVGLRYFNVYGPREQHKGSMASIVLQLRNQLCTEGILRLFEGSNGFGSGEQRRDFIYVKDVVDIILWFMEHPENSGIFNVGTGKSQSFNEVALALIKFFKYGDIQYIPFPDHLQGRYQSFTEANISSLRAAGYDGKFRSIESGVHEYMNWLEKTATCS